MEVMRSKHDSLLTIVEVLLYDPLYTWTLSPEKAALLQKIGEQEDAAAPNDANHSGRSASLSCTYRGRLSGRNE